MSHEASGAPQERPTIVVADGLAARQWELHLATAEIAVGSRAWATPEILPYRRQGPDGVLRYLRQRCPEYLVIFPEWFPELAARADLFRPLTEVSLAQNWVAGAPTMTVYETVWHRARTPAPAACPAPAGG